MNDTTVPSRSPNNIVDNSLQADANLLALATTILESWREYPQFALQWISVAEAEQLVDSFGVSHERNKDLKINRRVVSSALRELNQEIDQATEHVKKYIANKFTTAQALSYYPTFGLEKTSKHNRLPIAHDKRLLAIKQMVKGLKEYQMADMPYGVDYWEEVLARFEEARARNANKVGNTKAEQKVMLRRLFNSLICLLRANYPLTWRGEVQKWGFGKEKY